MSVASCTARELQQRRGVAENVYYAEYKSVYAKHIDN